MISGPTDQSTFWNRVILNIKDRKEGQKNFTFKGKLASYFYMQSASLLTLYTKHPPFLQSFSLITQRLHGYLAYSPLFQGAAFPTHQEEMRSWRPHAFSLKVMSQHKDFNLIQRWYLTSRSNDSIILNTASVTFFLDEKSCTQTMYFKETVNVSRTEKSLLSALILFFRS